MAVLTAIAGILTGIALAEFVVIPLLKRRGWPR